MKTDKAGQLLKKITIYVNESDHKVLDKISQEKRIPLGILCRTYILKAIGLVKE